MSFDESITNRTISRRELNRKASVINSLIKRVKTRFDYPVTYDFVYRSWIKSELPLSVFNRSGLNLIASDYEQYIKDYEIALNEYEEQIKHDWLVRSNALKEFEKGWIDQVKEYQNRFLTHQKREKVPEDEQTRKKRL